MTAPRPQAAARGTDVFTALADPTRRRVLELLASGERDAGSISREFRFSRPAVSRHLRVLRASGMVRVRTEATRRVYSLEPSRLAEVDEWLDRYRVFWKERLDHLDDHLARNRSQQHSRGKP